MRNSDSSTIAALGAARAAGLAPRQLVTIWARPNAGGEPEQFGFWDGVLPVELEVVGGRTGVTEIRSFQADGALIKVEGLRQSIDLKTRPANVQLNPLHPAVALLFAGYRLRLAAMEIHRVTLDVATRLPVAAARCRYLGLVETAARKKPKAGGEGSLTLSCVSDAIQLTRTNPAKRSDETQRLRSGDRMMQYAEVVGDWEISWGEAEPKAK